MNIYDPGYRFPLVFGGDAKMDAFMNIRGSLKKLLLPALCLIIGILFGAGYFYSQQHAPDQACITKYALTSQTLDCGTYEDASSRIRALDQALKDATALDISEGRVTRMSVWVRDLESRQWAASNENERYAPASLLKLPLMIAYYKLADIEPAILDTTLVYERSDTLNDSTQNFPPEYTLTEGQSYSVRDLIKRMIMYSDNDAAALLLNHIDQSIFENTMVDLGIKIPASIQNYDFITVKSYANIFRALYNASYLTRDFSEEALEIMASSSFRGIADPLPSSTVVAHKFGEREIDSADGSVETRELHDCGIIYKEDRPYILCVMTEGKDFATLLSVIKDISALTYSEL
jgi:beta-lactamase class A